MQAKYLFMASREVEPSREDAFNEVYGTEYVPYLTMTEVKVFTAQYRQIYN